MLKQNVWSKGAIGYKEVDYSLKGILLWEYLWKMSFAIIEKYECCILLLCLQIHGTSWKPSPYYLQDM
jgi:hypothetical protein